MDIKGYDLQERIGSGGFGVVHRAYQTTVGREVAIKIILPHYANQPDFIRRFETEAQLVARLEHLHIVPLYDYWRDPDGAYLVMRWLRGGDLKAMLKGGPIDLLETAKLLDQLATALAAAHRNGVIHRDIKPSNILLDEDGNAYLSDFGIAKDLSKFSSNTRTDMVIGSPGYLSPEQARSEPVSPRTDVYSLGVVLYEMLVGEHPFPDANPVERIYKHLNEPLPPLTPNDHLDASLVDLLNDIVQKATEKNPLQRYADALELAAAFREHADISQAIAPDSIVEQLTRREQEILQLIIDGLSNKEIADRLYITTGTVKWYIRQIYKKLRVRNRVQAVVRARELDLVFGEGAEVDESVSQMTFVTLPEPENPYKGLQAFQVADARDFFGREKITGKLIKRLAEKDKLSRFLAVVGPSGSGKSSLVKAGLIPALLRGDIPGSDRWFIVEMMPGARPLDELEIALTRVAADEDVNLNEHLTRDENGLLRLASLILPDDGSELVVVIDQFEEIFTLVEDEGRRTRFLDLIHAAVTDPRSRVRIVVTLRADFYDRPLQYPAFGELVRNRMETVLPLSADELERAIGKPAEHVGVKFEDGLVSSIIDEVLYQPGALPLLQYAMTELFERRQERLLTHEAYADIGGTVGALAKRADELYQEYDDAGQALIRQMFLRLVTLGEGTEDTRRRVPHSELLAIGNGSEDLIDDVINLFADYRLLALDHDPATRSPTVEVAHEALLQQWERLRSWLNDSRDDIKQQRQLATLTTEWEAHQRSMDFLVRGTRLDQFQGWSHDTTLTLTPSEHAFLAASLADRERRQAEAQAQAERESRLEQRARRVLRGLVGVFIVATIIASGMALVALNEQATAEDERDNAVEARNAEQVARTSAERSADEFRSIALTFGAQEALDNGQPDVALALAREAISMENPPVQAQQTFYRAVSSSWIERRFLVSDSLVSTVVYHPDGKRIITASWDGRVIVWDIATGEELQSISRDGRPISLAVRPDGNLVAIGGYEGLILLWNLDSNELTELTVGDQPQVVDFFMKDGKHLVTSADGRIYIWDLATQSLINEWVVYEGGASLAITVHLSSDESKIVTPWGGLVQIWDFETQDLLATFDIQTVAPDEGAGVDGVRFLPDSTRMLISLAAGVPRVILWDWQADEILWVIEGAGGDLALSPDQQTFLAGTSLYELETGSLLQHYKGHTNLIRSVDFSPDGQNFVSSSQDGTVIMWPVHWDGYVNSAMAPANASLAYHPTQPMVAVTGEIYGEPADPFIRLVDLDTGEIVQELAIREWAYSLAFTPDGRYLYSGDTAPSFDFNDQHVYLWDIETGEQVYEFPAYRALMLSIVLSHDADLVAVGMAWSDQVVLFDVQTHESVTVLEDFTDWVNAIAFSPDDDFLYGGTRDGSVTKWNVESSELIITLGEYVAEITDLDVSSDGKRLIVAFADGTAVVLDTDTGQQLFSLQGHTDRLTAAQFSPDDRYLMTAAADGTIILWDVETQARVRIYVTGTVVAGPGPQATFSPDGRFIISGSGHEITMWDASPLDQGFESWVVENRYIPDFTCEQRALYQIEPLCETE